MLEPVSFNQKVERFVMIFLVGHDNGDLWNFYLVVYAYPTIRGMVSDYYTIVQYTCVEKQLLSPVGVLGKK